MFLFFFCFQTIESSPTEESPESALSSHASPERQGRGVTPESGESILSPSLCFSYSLVCSKFYGSGSLVQWKKYARHGLWTILTNYHATNYCFLLFFKNHVSYDYTPLWPGNVMIKLPIHCRGWLQTSISVLFTAINWWQGCPCLIPKWKVTSFETFSI
jgi:hypothetical protein